MPLITDEQRKLLLKHGRFNTFRRERGEFEIDFKPVVKLFAPTHRYICLLSEIDPDDHDRIYGVWEAGRDPEVGYGSVLILGMVRDLTRDETFTAMKSLGQYAEEAIAHRRIVA